MTDRFRQQPRQREFEDPDESNRPIPWALGFLALAMVAWGTWYILGQRGSSDMGYGDGRTLAALAAAPPGEVDGAQVYTGKCAACHQANGQGLTGVFPPLVNSDWVNGSPERLVQILLHGIQGPIEVNGVVYNGLMPAWKSLPDEEIAAVASYVRVTWGNMAGPITTEVVAAERARTADRTTAWQGGAELEPLR
jgi:mono/diheme cytochrome c family protein